MMVLTLIIIVDVLFKGEKKAMEKDWTEKATYVR